MKLGSGGNELHFVDSNVFFYAKIMDAEYGASCAEIIRKVQDGNIVAATSALVTLEVANALQKFGLANEVRDTIDSIFSLRIQVFDVERSDVRNAVVMFHHHRISPYDCVHVSVMRHAGIRIIVSADKDFDKIPGVERRDPKLFE